MPQRPTLPKPPVRLGVPVAPRGLTERGKSFADTVTSKLTYAGYSGGWTTLRALPAPVAYRLFRSMADAAWLKRGSGVRQLEANLARVVAPGTDLRELSRAGMRSYMRYWCDAFLLPDWTPDQVRSRVRLIDAHHITDALAAGKGACGALPHMGNWDLAGAAVTLAGIPVTSVAERLKPPELFERFVAFREQLGMEILPLTGGEDVFGDLAESVRANRFAPLLADRDITARGIEVRLAGELTRMPAGPAVLAMRTGSPLIPVTLWYEGREPHHTLAVRFHPPIEFPTSGRTRDKVSQMMQDLADVFTAAIAEHPQDWHMLQPLFLADLDPKRMKSPATKSPAGQSPEAS